MTPRYLVITDFGISDVREILVSFSMSLGVLYIVMMDLFSICAVQYGSQWPHVTTKYLKYG